MNLISKFNNGGEEVKKKSESFEFSLFEMISTSREPSRCVNDEKRSKMHVPCARATEWENPK